MQKTRADAENLNSSIEIKSKKFQPWAARETHSQM
jgi:hypothetical protein